MSSELPPEANLLDDQPIKRLAHKTITVEGYSRAAVQTYWRIPEFKIGFDLGAQPWAFMGTPTWFVSHTHIDHLMALPAYVARRRMMKMEPPTIYLPETAIDPVERILRQVSRLDRGRLPCRLVPRSRATRSSCRASWWSACRPRAIRSRRWGSSSGSGGGNSRPEFAELPGPAIRDLRLGGTEVTREIRIPRLAYLGDSSPQGLDACPAMYEAEVLIVEMTFVAPSHRKERIHKFGHMHLDDVVERRGRLQNELVIASHFSTRYHTRQIERYVRRSLPDMLGGRLHLWL